MSTDGVQKIIEEIEKSTGQKVSEILSEAEKKVASVLQDAQNRARQEEQSTVSRGEQEARRESQRILAEARISARRENVRAQEDVVQKSFARARDMLVALVEEGRADSVDYRSVLESLVRESVMASDAESLEVIATPRDRQLLSQKTLDKIAGQAGTESGRSIALRISGDELNALGGVVVRSSDGKVRVDNTFESRMERFRETIRTQVAKELFPRES